MYIKTYERADAVLKILLLHSYKYNTHSGRSRKKRNNNVTWVVYSYRKRFH